MCTPSFSVGEGCTFSPYWDKHRPHGSKNLATPLLPHQSRHHRCCSPTVHSLLPLHGLRCCSPQSCSCRVVETPKNCVFWL
ncbi:hypothetical protein LWI29_014502 [Acer saccharum]|uniref:Uncharacterized protein n=1 Tax=Acer saccharum TaxID=4024 RepID=A0AA39VC58_ACESA|nr:hypothetical protein LWI29_014502 [Acer saccharum]